MEPNPVPDYVRPAIPEGLEPRSFSAGLVWPEFGQEVTVEWRGPDRWAVCYRVQCSNRKGVLSYEMQNSSRTDAWKRSHRFPLEEAAKIAQQVLKSERQKAKEYMAWREAKDEAAQRSPQGGVE